MSGQCPSPKPDPARRERMVWSGRLTGSAVAGRSGAFSGYLEPEFHINFG